MSNHKNHRKRMDFRVLNDGFESLTPHEQLEHLLYAVIPRSNTNEIAHDLLDRFRTIDGIFETEVDELKRVKGVGPRTAMFLFTVGKFIGACERSDGTDIREILADQEAIEDFAKSYFYNRINEAFYVISLNSKRRINCVIKITEGTEGETSVYMEKLLKRIIMTNARSVVFVHNHPCGNVLPSISDIKISQDLKKALELLDIELLDSLIVSGRQCYSMTRERILK